MYIIINYANYIDVIGTILCLLCLPMKPISFRLSACGQINTLDM